MNIKEGTSQKKLSVISQIYFNKVNAKLSQTILIWDRFMIQKHNIITEIMRVKMILTK